MAFRGQHEHTLDSKDRLTVPARFRAALADGVVLSAGLEPCVEIYAAEDFAKLEARFMSEFNPLSSAARLMKRRFGARAQEESLDSAGRLRVPRHLIEHAGLRGPCTVIGATDHVEIWDSERWREQDAEIDATALEIAEGLAGGA